jgi:hypothetical protein
VIVRILGEGQWRLDAGHADALNELDEQVERSVEAGDEQAFRVALEQLLASVRQSGTEVGIDELVDSDSVLPPADASLEEVRRLLGDEGLIPG